MKEVVGRARLASWCSQVVMNFLIPVEAQDKLRCRFLDSLTAACFLPAPVGLFLLAFLSGTWRGSVEARLSSAPFPGHEGRRESS